MNSFGAETVMRTNSKAEQLAMHLQGRIDSQEFTEGEHIGTKSELLEQFSVAAGTLNEALRLLQSRGYIEVKPGPKGGAFVADHSRRVRLRHALIDTVGNPADLSDAIKVRDELEVLVAVEAARYCTAEDSERILAAEDALSRADNSQNHLKLIWALHREIAVTGRNRILTQVYNGLLDHIEQSTQAIEMSPTVPKGVNAETLNVHHELVVAITNNDIRGAVEAARRHTPIGKDYYTSPNRGLDLRDDE